MSPGELIEFRLRSAEEDVADLKREFGEMRGAMERLRNMILGATLTVAGSSILIAATAIYLGGGPG